MTGIQATFVINHRIVIDTLQLKRNKESCRKPSIQRGTRAIQSVYGYEYQGDNLLIARINVLMTFVEYMETLWQRKPTEKELKTIANIIAWNFWQMDGLTGTVPKGKLQALEPEVKPITMEELGWFAGIEGGKEPAQTAEQETTPPCRVYDWRADISVTFNSLKKENGV